MIKPMMKTIKACCVLALAHLTVGHPSASRSNHVLHEKRSESSKWRRTDRVHPEAIIPLRIGLTQNDLHTGYDRLMEVSHPSSSRYGKYMSAEEVHELFKPAEAAVESVKEWLVSEGVDRNELVHSENKGWLAVDLSAQHVERLFQTIYHVHEHENDDSVSVGCEQYSVPHHLADHIDYIRPGVKLSAPLKKRATSESKRSQRRDLVAFERRSDSAATSGLPADLQDCDVNMSPTCLRALYDIPAGHLATPGYELGLFEQGSYWEESDLNAFFANFAPWVPNGTFPVLKSIDGGKAPIDCHKSKSACQGILGEAEIDIDLATSLIYPQKVIDYQVDDSYYEPKEVAAINRFNTFLDALDGSYCNYTAYGITGDSRKDPKYPDHHKGGYKGKLQCGVYKPTNIISASYGEAEVDLPKKYSERQCNEFMKLGLQGHSIFIATGDYGVGSFPNDPKGSNGCLSNLAEGLNQTIFNSQYPLNCPYTTAVGATMLRRKGTVRDPELTMYVPPQDASPPLPPHFSSSGGFSNYYPRPSYQEAAVKHYLAQYDPGYPYYHANASGTNYGANGGLYNRGGRAFPDVSANGAYLRLPVAGKDGHWFGTSLAAPTFASVINLINEERAEIGKGPVGFVNPVLYENAWALNDITEGYNPNCGSTGFPAIEGWDPSTGLGTPNYPKLLKLFKSLP